MTRSLRIWFRDDGDWFRSGGDCCCSRCPATCARTWRRRVLAVVIAASTVLGLVSCETTREGEAPYSSGLSVLATYSGGEVTRDEYEGWLRCHRQEHDADTLTERLELVALSELLSARAVARGAQAETAVRVQLAQLEQKLLLHTLRGRIAERISFTDEQARAAFDADPENAYRPRRLRLRNIFKRADEDRETVRAEMEDIRRRLLEGADFAETARAESESQTRFSGGNMGFVAPGELREDIAEVVAGLEPGEISDVLETEDGFTILMCWGEQEARHKSFEEVADTVHQILERRELERRMTELESELIDAASPVYDLDAARGLDDPGRKVVRFTGGSLSVAELDVLLAGRPAGAPPRSEMTNAALQRLIEQHVFRSRAAHRARELGLDQDPELRERVECRRTELLALSEIKVEVMERMQPITEDEVRAELEAHPGRYRHPQAYRLAVIRLPYEESTVREVSRRARELVAALRSGESGFAESARSLSDHPSAADGGELGWIDRTQLMSVGVELFRTITGLEPGEIGLPVRRADGMWIVTVEHTRPARPMTFDEARPRIESRLGNQRVRELQRRVEADFRADLKLSIR